MNNHINLAYYFELIRFQVASSRHEILFSNPDASQQRSLQPLAHGLNLGYEYYLSTKTARITRALPSVQQLPNGHRVLEPCGEDSDWIYGSILDRSSLSDIIHDGLWP